MKVLSNSWGPLTFFPKIPDFLTFLLQNQFFIAKIEFFGSKLNFSMKSCNFLEVGSRLQYMAATIHENNNTWFYCTSACNPGSPD